MAFSSVVAHLHQQHLSPLFDLDELSGLGHSLGAKVVELIVQDDNRVHKVAMSFAIHTLMMDPCGARVYTRKYPACSKDLLSPKPPGLNSMRVHAAFPTLALGVYGSLRRCDINRARASLHGMVFAVPASTSTIRLWISRSHSS